MNLQGMWLGDLRIINIHEAQPAACRDRTDMISSSDEAAAPSVRMRFRVA